VRVWLGTLAITSIYPSGGGWGEARRGARIGLSGETGEESARPSGKRFAIRRKKRL
jgi:hypothetical protein